MGDRSIVARHQDRFVGPMELLLSIVEDDQAVRDALQRMLQSHGFATAAFASAEQFLGRAKTDGTACLILDVRMPGMTGLQATGAIRALPGGAEVPIVALTAQAMKGDRERILAAGMDAYLSKPVQPNELISVVDQLLRRGAAGETIIPRAAPPAGPPPDLPKADGPHGAHTPRR